MVNIDLTGCQRSTRYTVDGSCIPFRSVIEYVQDDSPRVRQTASKKRLNTVKYSREDLKLFIRRQSQRRSRSTACWIKNIGALIETNLNGSINEETLYALEEAIRAKYPSDSSIYKCYVYTRTFLEYLATVYQDVTINAYRELFKNPNRRKSKMAMYESTSIVTITDVKNLLAAVESDRSLPDIRKKTLKAIVLFLAYTGQRPVNASTITVQQVKEALSKSQPTITMRAEQDKCGIPHQVPIHPQLVPHLQYLMEGKHNNACIFDYRQLQRWLYKKHIMLVECDDHFVTKYLRKFFEQHSDELGFSDTYKSYMMAHGMVGVQWTNYKRIREEPLHTKYMSCWGDVTLE